MTSIAIIRSLIGAGVYRFVMARRGTASQF
jgi:hypothetical protein